MPKVVAAEDEAHLGDLARDVLGHGVEGEVPVWVLAFWRAAPRPERLLSIPPVARHLAARPLFARPSGRTRWLATFDHEFQGSIELR